MAKTPNSSTTSYASAADLFVYHDPNQVADLLVDGDDARPTVAEMAGSGTYGSRLTRFLKAASGRLEAACLVKKMYSPDDLDALTGVSREMMIKLVCDLCFWQLSQRKQPNAGDPKNVPGALEAYEALEKLQNGDKIFSFEETQAAGLPSVVPPNPAALVTPNVVGTAVRLFPNYGINRNRENQG